MFANVVGSTSVYELMGDTDARRIISECLVLTKNTSNARSGKIVTELGD
jgi:hypothetical protein